MSLMDEVRAFAVPRGSIALWWLGQNGYLLKSPEGTIAGIDLYLTDSCAHAGYAIDLSRRVPILIEPEDLRIHVFACTHNHQDHTDPETVERVRQKETAVFAGPHPSCGVYQDKGVEAERIHPAWPGCELEYRDLRLTGTFALPTDDTDLNHMGYVVQFGNGPRIYITGDTADHELVASAAKYKPEVMISCINGGFNNMSAWEAAGLAAKVKPRIAIPCHYDMFPDNSADPQQFRAALSMRAPGVTYHEMRHGEPLVLSAG